jgi:hypothetical protein
MLEGQVAQVSTDGVDNDIESLAVRQLGRGAHQVGRGYYLRAFVWRKVPPPFAADDSYDLRSRRHSCDAGRDATETTRCPKNKDAIRRRDASQLAESDPGGRTIDGRRCSPRGIETLGDVRNHRCMCDS